MALLFCESESAFAYFAALRAYLKQHGKPVALYSDKAGVFRSNRKEPHGGTGVTQFSRALSSLNIDIVCANTPAAKGRVERAHLTLQDRLVKELRLRAIGDIDAANAFAPAFLADYNRRFARAPHSEHDAHRPLLPSTDLDVVVSVSPHYSRRCGFHPPTLTNGLESSSFDGSGSWHRDVGRSQGREGASAGAGPDSSARGPVDAAPQDRGGRSGRGGYPGRAPSASAMRRQAWRSGVAVGRWRTTRRTETTTCAPSLSSRSRSHVTWVRAQAVPTALSRSSCIST